MGPRGVGLHGTKRHMGVLTWSLGQEGKTRETRIPVVNVSEHCSDEKDTVTSAMFPTASLLSSSLWCTRSCVTGGGRRHEQAAHRTGQSNTNHLFLFLKRKTCSQLMCVAVCVSLLCLFTVVFVLVYATCLCECAVYMCAKWAECCLCHSEVTEGAGECFIYLNMEHCNWIRGKLTGEVTTCVLRPFVGHQKL